MRVDAGPSSVRNAEARRTQSCCPHSSSALFASPRFKTSRAEQMHGLPRRLFELIDTVYQPDPPNNPDHWSDNRGPLQLWTVLSTEIIETDSVFQDELVVDDRFHIIHETRAPNSI
jgi:hypothetical protein